MKEQLIKKLTCLYCGNRVEVDNKDSNCKYCFNPVRESVFKDDKNIIKLQQLKTTGR